MTNGSKGVLPLRFPKRFLWGVSTSAHQVEGNTHNQWSVWELENARSLAKQAEYKLDELPVWDDIQAASTDPNNYVSGAATNHYELYKVDFKATAAMGMNAFRFSIEWSRLEPQEGEWNQDEIAHYREYLLELRRQKLEPVVTLMHWTLPVWFADMGGFEKRSNVKYFERFARKVFEEFGMHLRYVVTFNEPEVYVGQGWLEGVWPPNIRSPFRAYLVYRNIAYAHRRIYKLARSTNRRFRVGLSKNIVHFTRGDNKIRTKIVIHFHRYVADYWFLRRVKRKTDWLGVNYYFTRHYENGHMVHNMDAPLSDVGWEMEPANIQFVLERIFAKYKKPIIVTENGVADMHDKYRKWWISQTLVAMHKSMKNGVDLHGYLHWSLLDNFEWASGKWPRFGLLEVDYTTYRRTPRSSAIWFSKVIKNIRGNS